MIDFYRLNITDLGALKYFLGHCVFAEMWDSVYRLQRIAAIFPARIRLVSLAPRVMNEFMFLPFGISLDWYNL